MCIYVFDYIFYDGADYDQNTDHVCISKYIISLGMPKELALCFPLLDIH